MTPFAIVAVIITVTALLGYANERWIKLPTTIGVMLGGLLLSVFLVVLGQLGIGAESWAESILARIDFDRLLMHGMLSFLLFAGALHVNLNELLRHRTAVLVLATIGTLVSTLLVGGLVYVTLPLLGIDIPFVQALLFGALISPTDPIAVLAILRRAGTPKSLEVLITGESLFNDGVGVVLFTTILGIALGGAHGHVEGPSDALLLFAREALGGAAYGLVLGYIAYEMLRRVDDYTVEVLITLAVVTGGYALASALHISGPLAMVMAGILIGNQGRRFAMSERTRAHLDPFWLVVDEVLNAILFVLIGIEVLIVPLTGSFLLAGALAIPLVLFARFVSVSLPIGVLRLRREFERYTIRLMTWGGLRGGIAIALALSLPATPLRGLLLVMTYAVVLFSILVQGTTVGPLTRRAFRERGPAVRESPLLDPVVPHQ